MSKKYVKVMFDTTSGASDFEYKINEVNIDEALEEWNDFISHGGKEDRNDINAFVKEIEHQLYSIKEK